MPDHIHTCHLRCTNPDCVERTRLELQKVCAERDELREKMTVGCKGLRAALIMLNERDYRKGTLRVNGVLLKLEAKP